MITGHRFRPGHATGTTTGAGNSRGQAVVPGMCAWLGTCNRPESEHALQRTIRSAAAVRAGA